MKRLSAIPGNRFHDATSTPASNDEEIRPTAELQIDSHPPSQSPPTFTHFHVNLSQLKTTESIPDDKRGDWTRQRRSNLFQQPQPNDVIQGPNDAPTFTTFNPDAVIDVVRENATHYNNLQSTQDGIVYGYVEISYGGKALLRLRQAGSSNDKLVKCFFPNSKLTHTQTRYRLRMYWDPDGINHGALLAGLFEVRHIKKNIIASKLGWIDDGQSVAEGLVEQQMQLRDSNPHWSTFPSVDFSTNDPMGLAVVGGSKVKKFLRDLSDVNMGLFNDLRRACRNLECDPDRSRLETNYRARNPTNESASKEAVIEEFATALANNINAIDALAQRRSIGLDHELKRLAGEANMDMESQSSSVMELSDFNIGGGHGAKLSLNLIALTHKKRVEGVPKRIPKGIPLYLEHYYKNRSSIDYGGEIPDSKRLPEQLKVLMLALSKVFTTKTVLESFEVLSKIRECAIALYLLILFYTCLD